MGAPPGTGASADNAVAIVALVVGLLLIVIVPFVGLAIGNISIGGSGCVLGLALLVFGVVRLYQVSATRSTVLPLPPPVQQPPAGPLGATRINCPNCGGPPKDVDRFGVATCTYCSTRFLVQ